MKSNFLLSVERQSEQVPVDPAIEQPTPMPPALPRAGMAITSLVLGITAVCFSFILIGGLFGLIGLTLGLVHLRRERVPKAMAWWGFSLSLFGLLASIGVGVSYLHAFKRFKAVMGPPTETLTEWEGVAAPDFTFVSLDGKKTTLSSLKGKRVILDFWATWCPPCRKEIPHFIRLVSNTSINDLFVIGISSEDEETLRPFVKQQAMNYPVASMDTLSEPYRSIRSIPTTVFIDRQGIIQRYSGRLSGFPGPQHPRLPEGF